MNDFENFHLKAAVNAIDTGDINLLRTLLITHTQIVNLRFDQPDEGYFKNPYLLWFIADNPIRVPVLPDNILEIARILVDAVKNNASETAKQQLDYALNLVATGSIVRECGVQIALMDLLIDEGAACGNSVSAFAHGNLEAGRYLLACGAPLTLTAAVCLNDNDNVIKLLSSADTEDKEAAITAAAFYGNATLIECLLKDGTNPNAYPDKSTGFFTHGTPLHQAVASGSLKAVKLLLDADADPSLIDSVYSGTPLGWALHMAMEETDPVKKLGFNLIADHLSTL